MKSSTIRRSTLSKETMEVIETLARENEENGLPGEYVRPDEIESVKSSDNNRMAQEIDLLWQNFKPSQFNTNSPLLNVFIGFVIGVITTLAVLACMGVFSNNPSSSRSTKPVVQQEQTLEEVTSVTEEASVSEEQAEENSVSQEEQVTDVSDTSGMTKYVIKSGDTVESIIRNHYGSYSDEKAELVKRANNMSSLDRINIDQELLLP